MSRNNSTGLSGFILFLLIGIIVSLAPYFIALVFIGIMIAALTGAFKDQ